MEEAPQLFYEDPAILLTKLTTWYETRAGKTLSPNQPEALLIQMVAYMFTVFRAQADSVNSQNLSRFATAPNLDYLAENQRVQRLDAIPAVTVLRFSLVEGHATVTIEAGTRVRTVDGMVMFSTDVDTVIAPSTLTVDIKATATSDGLSGNGYGAGTITDIVDPIPFVSAVTNTVGTSGGSDAETNDGLRVRIRTSSGQYSTAGSAVSYKYHAFSANPQIIDVSITQPVQGTVNIYPLIAGGGETPQSIIDAVYAATSGETVRPINDIVNVISPEPVEYQLEVDITLKFGAVQTETVNRVTAALSAFCTEKSKKLGEDITLSGLIAAGMNENVYSLSFGSFLDLVINKTSFAVCTEIAVGTVDYEDVDA